MGDFLWIEKCWVLRRNKSSSRSSRQLKLYVKIPNNSEGNSEGTSLPMLCQNQRKMEMAWSIMTTSRMLWVCLFVFLKLVTEIYEEVSA